MSNPTPTKEEVFERFWPKVQQTAKRTIDKFHVPEDSHERDDLEGVAYLKFAELLEPDSLLWSIWDENREKSENFRDFEKYLHLSIYRGILYERRRETLRDEIVEILADTDGVASKTHYFESQVDASEYFETAEEQVLHRLFLAGATTKEIADTLCLTQKKTRELMDRLAMQIQADQSKEARRANTRLAAKT